MRIPDHRRIELKAKHKKSFHRADAMLKLDLASLANEQLEQLVTKRCAKFGLVKRVKVVRGHNSRRREFAIVQMSSPPEFVKLCWEIGDEIHGHSVVIWLEQETEV